MSLLMAVHSVTCFLFLTIKKQWIFRDKTPNSVILPRIMHCVTSGKMHSVLRPTSVGKLYETPKHESGFGGKIMPVRNNLADSLQLHRLCLTNNFLHLRRSVLCTRWWKGQHVLVLAALHLKGQTQNRSNPWVTVRWRFKRTVVTDSGNRKTFPLNTSTFPAYLDWAPWTDRLQYHFTPVGWLRFETWTFFESWHLNPDVKPTLSLQLDRTARHTKETFGGKTPLIWRQSPERTTCKGTQLYLE